MLRSPGEWETGGHGVRLGELEVRTRPANLGKVRALVHTFSLVMATA